MNRKIITGATLMFVISLVYAQINVGKTLSNVKIKDPNNKEAILPFFGQKVLAIFYNDPDVKDVNDPLSDAIKAKAFPKDKYNGIGIANTEESWLPNSVIRYASRQKQAKYPNSVILVDDNNVISKSWELGDCNDKGYIIIIGKDQKVKYAKAVKSQEESKAIINSVVAIIESEIAKIK